MVIHDGILFFQLRMSMVDHFNATTAWVCAGFEDCVVSVASVGISGFLSAGLALDLASVYNWRVQKDTL